MQPTTTPPGSFSTIAIALLSFIFLLSFTIGFAVLRGDAPSSVFEPWFPLMGGVAMAAGFVWRSPRIVQFHACFWSGLSVLGATLVLVTRMMAALRAGDDRYQVQAAPCFIILTTTFGLILLVTALCLDRPAQRSN